MAESHTPAALQRQLFRPEAPSRVPEDAQPAWTALENVAAERPEARLAGLVEMESVGALGKSPLAAWVAAALLSDTDAAVRAKAVAALADVLAPGVERSDQYDEVRWAMAQRVQVLRLEDIAQLVEDRPGDPAARRELGLILNLNSGAGSMLAVLALDRRRPPSVRREAVRLIGDVGFVEAREELERLAHRLQARARGQKAMPFAPPLDTEEDALLPELTRTLELLGGHGPA